MKMNFSTAALRVKVRARWRLRFSCQATEIYRKKLKLSDESYLHSASSCSFGFGHLFLYLRDVDDHEGENVKKLRY